MSENQLALKQLNLLVEAEHNYLAKLANFVAFLYDFLPEVNWLGFYFIESDTKDLVLGPFQGKVACSRLKFARGVCQAAIKRQKTLVVADVHQFDDHIMCDSQTAAEMVVPVCWQGKLMGVLDIDSPQKNRFTQQDVEFIEQALNILLPTIGWESLMNFYSAN